MPWPGRASLREVRDHCLTIEHAWVAGGLEHVRQIVRGDEGKPCQDAWWLGGEGFCLTGWHCGSRVNETVLLWERCGDT